MGYVDDMKEVWIQDAQVKLDKENLKEKIGNAKRSFKQENKKWIRIIDICLILVIIFNASAVFLTNVMVMKVYPNSTIVEANPNIAKQGNFETTPEVQEKFSLSMYIATFWFILLSVYIYNRVVLFRKWQLYLLTSLVVMLLFLTGMDLINNLGYWFGSIIFT